MKNRLMTIEQIESIRAHSNADRLDVIRVSGYDAIVPKGTMSENQIVAFIHPDACLPVDRDWAKPYLGFVSSRNQRVKAKKLRDEWSFGIAIPIEALTDSCPEDCFRAGFVQTTENDIDWIWVLPSIGFEISEAFGVTKYDPPLPTDISVKGPLRFSATDEERYQTLNIADLFGQNVILTEKIDGTSITIYRDGDESGYCMRNWELKIPDSGVSNRYWSALGDGFALNEFAEYCQRNNLNLALRGEVFGAGVQTNKNNRWSQYPKNGVRWFSALNLDTREYLTFKEFRFLVTKLNEYITQKYSDKHIDLFTTVEYWHAVLSQDLIEVIEKTKNLEDLVNYIDGEPLWLTNTGMFEGIVVNWEKNGHRESFKVINKVYDEGKE